jgi:inhibitor of cysteine peptidase
VWFAAGAVYAFSLPFIFSSLFEVSNDLYYAIYFSGIALFLVFYIRATQLDVVALFTRNWRLSVGLGVVTSLFLVVGVLQRENPTPHPEGVAFLVSIAWRGLLYGVIDALILTAFPVAVAYAFFDSRLDTVIRKSGFALLALALSLVITTTYHLGYKQFREDGVGGPVTGNAIISIPALLTTNPAGSVVAHASMHVAANIHAYETDLYLPPQATVRSSTAFSDEIQLTDADDGATVQLAVGGTLIIALRSNPTTGYSWAIAGDLPQTLRVEGEARFVPAGSTQPVLGAGGTEVWTFTAVSPGDADLKLGYRRPFETNLPLKTFSVIVLTQ